MTASGRVPSTTTTCESDIIPPATCVHGPSRSFPYRQMPCYAQKGMATGYVAPCSRPHDSGKASRAAGQSGPPGCDRQPPQAYTRKPLNKGEKGRHPRRSHGAGDCSRLTAAPGGAPLRSKRHCPRRGTAPHRAGTPPHGYLFVSARQACTSFSPGSSTSWPQLGHVNLTLLFSDVGIFFRTMNTLWQYGQRIFRPSASSCCISLTPCVGWRFPAWPAPAAVAKGDNGA